MELDGMVLPFSTLEISLSTYTSTSALIRAAMSSRLVASLLI